MRRNHLYKCGCVLMVLCLLFIMAGCTDNSGSSSSTPGTSQSQPEDGGIEYDYSKAINREDLPQYTDEEYERYLGKFDPIVEISIVKAFDDPVFDEGDDIYNNPYTRMYEYELGVRYTYLWTSSGAQYSQKMNASIASGDLPDIMVLNPQQFDMLAESDMLYDLTDLYESMLRPEIKERFDSVPAQMANAMYDGKLMAIPAIDSMVDQAPMMWIRYDWLEKLNLDVPKTMEQVYSVMQAFVENDPDGVGNIVGMAMGKYVANRTQFTSILGFFAGYHAYPDGWVVADDGTLAYGAVQPQTKAALAVLAEMYKNGLLDTEFAVYDGNKMIESVVSGQAGIVFNSMSSPISMKDLSTVHPDADWRAYPLPSVDGEPAKPMANATVNTFIALNKNCKNPEAYFKMINLLDLRAEDRDLSVTPAGNQIWMYGPDIGRPISPTKNYECYEAIKDAFASGDASGLNAETLQYYDYIGKFREGDNSDNLAWAYDRVFGDFHSSFSVVDHYIENDLVITSAFSGTFTETMIARNATLEDLRDEVFVKIIMGESSIDDFDTFVDNWYSQGGTDVTAEVNEWYQKR